MGEQCFGIEEFDWFLADVPLRVDPAEWPMLEAMLQQLAFPVNDQRAEEAAMLEQPIVEANIIVDRICVADCNGRMAVASCQVSDLPKTLKPIGNPSSECGPACQIADIF